MANDTVGQWNGSAAHLRKRKKKAKAWLRRIKYERQQAEGLLEWVTRKLAAAEAAERLGRAWRDQATQ